jgi:hypothetical protein
MADQGAHAPDQLGRAERPVVMKETRAAVDDLDALAGMVEEARAQDCRARLVCLLERAKPPSSTLRIAASGRPPALSTRAWKIGSPSKRGMQHQTILARASISALMAQLPINPTSRLAGSRVMAWTRAS